MNDTIHLRDFLIVDLMSGRQAILHQLEVDHLARLLTHLSYPSPLELDIEAKEL